MSNPATFKVSLRHVTCTISCAHFATDEVSILRTLSSHAQFISIVFVPRERLMPQELVLPTII
jgi:hypothetical protein